MNQKIFILVVDDDQSLLNGTCGILRNAGYETIQAATGTEGLRLAEEYAPDLILLDVLLPDIDGYEFCRRIKGDVKFADTYVALISSVKTDSDHQASGLETGADGYIARPVSNVELLARVESLLRLKRAEKTIRQYQESRDNFLAFFESIDDMIIVGAQDEQIIYTNPAVSRKLGYTPEELKSMRMPDLRPGERFPVETRAWFGKWSGMDCIFVISKDLSKEQEALQKFDRLFNLNPAPMAVSSLPERQFTDVNEAFLSTLGFSRDEIIGKTSAELGLFVEHATHDKVAEMLKEQRSIRNIGLKVRRKDGAVVDGLFSGEMIENQGRESFLTVMTDITQQKRAENQLGESEKAYRTLSENIPGIVYRVYLDDPVRMEFFNSMVSSITGFTEYELMNGDICSIDPLILQEDRIGVIALVKNALVDDKPFEVEYRIRHKNGEIRNLLEYGRPVKDSTGSHSHIDGVIFDITARKIMEEALRKSEKKYRELAELLPQIVFETDTTGKYTYVNSVASKITGYSIDEFLTNLMPAQLVIPGERERIAENIENMNNKQELFVDESMLLKKDGAKIPVLVYAAPIFDNEKMVGVRGIVIDTSPIKKAEEEKEKLRIQLFESQKMESLGTLVGGIAHDFNNMLQVILGYSDLLLDDKKEGEPGYDHLQTIIQTGKEGAELVEKLLAFGQQGQVSPTRLNLNDQLMGLTTLISRTLPKIIQVDMDLTDRSTIILADKGQIDQLVINLAVNASEAMPKGGTLKILTRVVSLEDDYCRFHVGVNPGNCIMLSVSDTGRGMDKETLARIFDPFFSTKQRGAKRGTGLGLSVVRGIVQQQGGHILCESEPGKGTEFKIYFPAISEPLMAVKTVEPQIQPGTPETILVVEDNIPVAELERRGLEQAGYSVIVATNGRVALDIYQTRKDEISLVILDLLMPEMSGRDCLMELLKIDPSVKALIVSGYSPEDDLHREIRTLVKGIVHKPFGMAQFLDAVESVLLDK